MHNHTSIQARRADALPHVFVQIALALACAAILLALTGCGSAGQSASAEPVSFEQGSDITLATTDITETASLFDYDAGGITVEMIAVRASGGAVHLALNTCQVCNGSPYAYFVQEGSDFICQNCKNAFAGERLGIESGGCNPVPVTSGDYTEQDGEITVSASFFEDNAWRFVSWKKF